MTAQVTAPLAKAGAPPNAARTYVWDRVVRSTHWLVALSIVVLAVTGLLIGHPVLVSPGPAGEHFVMGTVKVIHFYAAITFTLAVLVRLAWLFMGPKYARWDQLIPVSRERRRNVWATLKFYLLVNRRLPVYPGHNALAGLAYCAIFLLYLIQIATGLGLYALDASVGSPMRAFRFVLEVFGGAQSTRWIHHGVTWVFALFLLQHLYSCFLASRTEGNGEFDSIVSGYKHVHPPGEDERG